MPRQQSNTDLAGSLAATLTPRVSDVSVHLARGQQNSGLFDVGALYAEALDEVMRRTRAGARSMPVARAAQSTWPTANRAAQLRAPVQPWRQPVVHEEVVVEYVASIDAPRAGGLGWFGIAVAWLATVTMGAGIAVTLPAHAIVHSRAGAVAGGVVASAGATPAASSPPAIVLPSVASPSPTYAPSGSVPGAQPAIQKPPIAATAPTPAALATSAPPVVSPRVLAKKPARPIAAAAVTHTHPASAAVVAAAPSEVSASTPRSPGPARSASVPAPAAASTAGMSLDDLIRHEVQAESAKHR